jgi:small subunit ribosomal protein S16
VSVKLRLKRFGRRNRASYRVNAIDSRTARDGRVIEELGFYDPVAKDTSKQFSLNVERAAYWLSVGAEPSATVKTLLRKAGVEVKGKVTKKVKAKIKAKAKKKEA